MNPGVVSSGRSRALAGGGSRRVRRVLWGALPAATLGAWLFACTAFAAPVVPVVQSFGSPTAIDQDDMCVWVHPQDPESSLVIATDKYAGNVLVYDLAGNQRQSIYTGKPGNIDVRYGFTLAGSCVDLVAFNERREDLIRVYRVDPAARVLVRVDDGAIDTGSNYGFTLHRPPGGNLYAVTGSGLLRQYLLFESSPGTISGTATGWSFTTGVAEGMVGDDETGYVYLAEESAGIWKIDALDAADASLIARVGDASGLASNVEGITIYYAAQGGGAILASSQGPGYFNAYDRLPPHAPLGRFELDGVGATDGIDVVNVSLNGVFTAGIFLAHNGHDPSSIAAARWEDVAAVVPGALVDTEYWDPRACGVPSSAPETVTAPRVVLDPGSPNPVNRVTRIRFTLPEASPVRLAVYDPSGRWIATLTEGMRSAGTHAVEWRAADALGMPLPNGVYVCRLEAGGTSASIKLVVAR